MNISFSFHSFQSSLSDLENIPYIFIFSTLFSKPCWLVLNLVGAPSGGKNRLQIVRDLKPCLRSMLSNPPLYNIPTEPLSNPPIFIFNSTLPFGGCLKCPLLLMKNLQTLTAIFSWTFLLPYTGWPNKNGTVDTVDFSGLCSDQQLSFFSPCWTEHLFLIIITPRSSTLVENFFILWVISYGLSFSGFARFQWFWDTINDKLMAYPENDSP